MSMDHISKALEKSRAEGQDAKRAPRQHRVRDWVRPTSSTDRSSVDHAFRTVELDREILRQNHILVDGDDPYNLDRYRVLRTRMLMLMKSNRWHSVGITSPGAQDGKSLTATNLALAVARDDVNEVFLIDADLRKPSLPRNLGFEVEYGLADFLRGDAELHDVAVQPDIYPNLVVLPGRRDENQPAESELLRSSRTSELFEQIRAHNRDAVIIVDFPPILVGDDVLALAPKLDSMLLVISEGRTNVDELTSAVELLADFNLLGTVLNRSTAKKTSSQGYYGYYQPGESQKG